MLFDINLSGVHMSKNINRRHFIKASVASSLLLGAPAKAEASEIEWATGQNESRYPIQEQAWLQTLKSRDIPYDGLVTSLKSENHYVCEVKGNLPLDLQGTLLRAGTGLLERGGMRRRMLIDADGMVRRFQIRNGQAVFTNRHIRTPKFVADEKAGKFIHPSFAMLVPSAKTLLGGRLYNPFTNSIANVMNQAGITAFSFGGRVFVTDEIQPLTELDPVTLATKGEPVLLGNPSLRFMAHARITYFGQKILHLAALNPMNNELQIVAFNERFQKVGASKSMQVPRSFHDWHVTPEFYVIFLPPLYLGKSGLAKALGGFSTVADAMEFKAEERAQVLLIPRNGRSPLLFNLPETLDGIHAVNAYQKSSSEVVFDFVASKKHLPIASNRSNYAALMRGESLAAMAPCETAVYRTILNYDKKFVTYGANHFGLTGVEMPTIDSRLIGQDYTNAYFACFMAGQGGQENSLVRLNVKTGEKDKYDFGPAQFVTEPVLAPSKQGSNAYLLSEVYNHQSKKSFLAVFDASHLKQGPIAEVWLQHHLPFGFHGFWQSA
jgi:all-trans-8'-apo-beta-carotenal 15,15'-oxygenase